MKQVFFICIAAFFGLTANADTMCGRLDIGALDELQGQWISDIAISLESETLSVTEVEEKSVTSILAGALRTPLIARIAGPDATVSLTLQDTFYDVDGVDNMLDTTDSAWIADSLSDTPCGPESLMQFSGLLVVAGANTGRVTVIPYFTDRVLLIAELEMRGDFGLAFVTATGLLQPKDD